ncbi:MAG: HAMP domain-containing sensor histidine kinase [Rhodanobacter sp.]
MRSRVWRTAAFRMALWQAALFALLGTALLGLVWLRINDYAQDELHSKVATEMASLHQSYADGTLEMQLRQRLAVLPAGQDYYLLADPQRRVIVGNLVYRPDAVGWHVMLLRGAIGKNRSDADEVHLYVAHFPDGRWLMVGRDNRSVVELGELVSNSFIDVGVLAIVLVLLSGGLASWRYLRRIDALGAHAERVLEGAQALPLVGSGHGDEIDRLAARLNRLLGRMQVLMEGMRQVSNDIAHDLRTPLARARQRLEASLADSANSMDAPGLRHAIGQAVDDIDGLLTTFHALLRIASVEARQRRSGFEKIDLSALFEDIAETYQAVAEDNGRPFEARIANGQSMYGDRALLTQMLVNLVENSLHHTPPGSRLRMDLQVQTDAVIGRVTDTGPGIRPEAREQVLKRFVRLDSSRSRPGAGLGLALAAAVCDLHDIALVLRDAMPGLMVELRFPGTGVSQ